MKRLSRKAATRIWLIVLDLAGLITVYELTAINHLFGWHTISYWSFVYQGLGWFITAAMLTVVGWWIYHFHHSHFQ